MTTEEIIELAIQGHASTRDAIRWAIKQEREECAKVCEAGAVQTSDWDASYWNQACENRAAAIRARGQE